ncbi:quinol monooxygenase YgiN [Kitasatospora sp. MAP5-34]|nr:quinol monooxygenase YgiN [Kitasatospora sp. MAP5-34]
MYSAWQQEDDPTKFVHLFIFADEQAHAAHGSSDAVRAFEAVYSPELVGGPVVFTDYRQVASNTTC